MSISPPDTATAASIPDKGKYVSVKKSLQRHVAQSPAFLPQLSAKAGDCDRMIGDIISNHYNQRTRKWKKWPQGLTPGPVYPVFHSLTKLCCDPKVQFLGKSDAQCDASEPISLNTSRGRYTVLCQEYNDPLTEEALLCLGAHVQEHLSPHIFINYVYGILLSWHRITFVRFDRAGAILSESISMADQPESFIKCLSGFAVLAKDSETVDDTISFLEQPLLLSGSSAHDATATFALEECLYDKRTLCGTSTRIFQIHNVNHPEGKYVLKDWWRSRDDADEAEILRKVSGLFGLPEYVSHWLVRGSNGAVQDTAFLDENLVPVPEFIAEHKWNKIECDGPDPDEEEPPFIRQLRVHSRLVVKQRGYHLIQFRESPLVVLIAIHDAVLGHWSLYKAGYVHRDVSYGNILVLPFAIAATKYQNHERLPVPALSNQCTAILNDFDNTVLSSELNATMDAGQRPKEKGTIAYMSAHLLRTKSRINQSVRSLVLDDLESFLWVLIVTATSVDCPSPVPSGWDSSAECWIQEGLFREDITNINSFAYSKYGFLDRFSSKSWSPFEFYDDTSRRYGPVITKLSDYMLARDSDRKKATRAKQPFPIDDDTLYLDVLNILREAIQSCGESV
ncbi:hypothetical protein SISNIDRAFT_485341 [Sistotremastrum niveocremeum HHB9708]|uniref:Fungal-type protein kinase domain-containing protein n=1 Tax=Sistotremastrum niveocremeum HHB9708 TaxID=1314777 RepID=A0A164V1E9_9AGAM|nr:hypothetical protein SISNIDRAFT_485341 [Sistotremastrum niveocremeum HHB9708]